MAREEEHPLSLAESVIGGLLALAIIFISANAVISGLSDPDKATSIKSALQIGFGGVFLFFSLLYLALLSGAIAQDYKENKVISLVSSVIGIILFISAVAVVIFLSIEYPIFAIGFAFFLLEIFLLAM
jgi:hypothetical protein